MLCKRMNALLHSKVVGARAAEENDTQLARDGLAGTFWEKKEAGCLRDAEVAQMKWLPEADKRNDFPVPAGS
ncbi:hypothetical protein EVAR_2730_1 [Eumeta japonica]|uniref:Uncharacterized protein n=1 Tax=Eumeta variegata TaxID=151549 RepID=A0A4C1SZF7_EUMVA|nr:hypothetical protein EVAR_2730_1 [Eumeta japonica]